jgi:putative FmdB family regulatory protein
MPIYEYVCDDCTTRYERLVLSQRTEITCPRCSSRRHTLQFSVIAAPICTPMGTGTAGEQASGVPASADPGAGCGCTPRTSGCH